MYNEPFVFVLFFRIQEEMESTAHIIVLARIAISYLLLLRYPAQSRMHGTTPIARCHFPDETHCSA
jgi:hypothetical protein